MRHRILALWCTVPVMLAGCQTYGSEDVHRPDPESVTMVTELLVGDTAAQNEAVARSSALGSAGVRPIATLLDHQDPQVRKAALQCLWNVAEAASRPTARAERQLTSRALLFALREHDDLPAMTRSALVHMLALTADDDVSVRDVALLMDDPDLAPAALFALERIDLVSAGRALALRLTRPSAVPIDDVIDAIGARRSAVGIEVLMRLSGTDQHGAAARAALARIGDPRAERLLAAAVEAGRPGSYDDWLRYLEARQGTVPRAWSVAGYRALLAAPNPWVRAAALDGLGRVGDPALFRALISALGDPSDRVRGTARQKLVALEDGETGAKLALALDGASPEVHAEILRVLTRRGDSVALARVRAAASSGDLVVRVTALELLGEFDTPDVETILLAATDSDSEPIRTAAAASLRRHAGRHVARGDGVRAAELLHLVLSMTTSEAVLGPTLESLADLASPASLEPIAPFADVPEYREDVARARLAIARSLDDEAVSIALLRSVYDASLTRSTRSAAVEALAARGVDTSGFAPRAGFLTTWQVLGPFPKASAQDLGSHPFGAGGPDLTTAYPVRGVGTRFVPLESSDPDGVVDLRFLEPNTDAAAFAACVVDWPAAAEVTLKIGSDDAVAVWVQGRLVHENFVARGVSIDEDAVVVPFEAGKNTILVKVGQGGGDWGFCVRVADRAGEPIDLTAIGSR